MLNYLIKVEYEGTYFVGWQSQKNGKSIQDEIEKVLKKILKTKIRITGAGRTDKGVHAFSQYASFKVKRKIENKKVFIESVNYFLKNKLISILDIRKKSNNFHARHSAKLRTYEYLISNRQANLSINKNRAWHVKKKMNLNLLKKGAKLLEGTHNFSTFRAASCAAKSPIKKMNYIKIGKLNDIIKIRFSSQSFLQNQVRSMVGCLKYLATNRWSIDDFKLAFKSKKRSNCAPPAPACGLYLYNIKY